MTSARFSQTQLVEGQASGETTANEYLAMLEIIMNGEVLDRDLTTPPGSPSDGDLYIVAASATGAWTGEDGNLAYYLSGWKFITPKSGLTVFITDEKVVYAYSAVESLWFPVQKIWSTTEHWTGLYSSISGGKIYSKVIEIGALPNTTMASTAHSISTIDFAGHVRSEHVVRDDVNSVMYPGNGNLVVLTGTHVLEYTVNATNVVVNVTFDATDWDMTVRLEYEKV